MQFEDVKRCVSRDSRGETEFVCEIARFRVLQRAKHIVTVEL